MIRRWQLRGSNGDRIVLAIILSVSLVIAYYYFDNVDYPNLELRIKLHKQILRGTAPSPLRYRVLVPFFTEMLVRSIFRFFPYSTAFLISYGLYDVATIFFLLLMLFYYLRIWFSRDQSLVGCLFVAGTITIALRGHFFQPWSLLEVPLFTLGLLFIYKRKYALLFLVVLLSSLNRETAVFIPLAFLFTTVELKKPDKRWFTSNYKYLLLFFGYFLLWLFVYMGILYFRGTAPLIHSIEWILAENLTIERLKITFRNISLFLGFFWIFAILGIKHAPHYVRRTMLIIPFYLSGLAILALWNEVRVLMLLYPILIPLGLSFIYSDYDKNRDTAQHS